MKFIEKASQHNVKQPMTPNEKYGAVLGILTGIMANEEVFHMSKALDALIWTFENNATNEAEQFILDQVKRYKEGPTIFPFGDYPETEPIQKTVAPDNKPLLVSDKIFDLSLTHPEMDIVVGALFNFHDPDTGLTADQEALIESVYAKIGINTTYTING